MPLQSERLRAELAQTVDAYRLAERWREDLLARIRRLTADVLEAERAEQVRRAS